MTNRAGKSSGAIGTARNFSQCTSARVDGAGRDNVILFSFGLRSHLAGFCLSLAGLKFPGSAQRLPDGVATTTL